MRASPSARSSAEADAPGGHKPAARLVGGGLLGGSRVRFIALALAIAAFYAFCVGAAEIDLARLCNGLPRLAAWAARAWPPDFSDLPTLLQRAAETVAMATLGTTLGAVIAVPLCLAAARTTAPAPAVHYLARLLLNGLRGVDSFVFALLFVAAVGLGPFAGLLGVGLHSAGSIAKLWAEAIETAAPEPLEAAAAAGAGRLKVIVHALLPDVLPGLASILLYVWEFNMRASTVLGIVGAGGIGQELKSAIDLLDFPRVLAIILIVLAMVTAVDQLSAYARRRLS
jgi:phosphonate transport system permease protein